MLTTQPAQSALVESANVSFPLSADLNGFNFEQSSLCFPKELFYAVSTLKLTESLGKRKI